MLKVQDSQNKWLERVLIGILILIGIGILRITWATATYAERKTTTYLPVYKYIPTPEKEPPAGATTSEENPTQESR